MEEGWREEQSRLPYAEIEGERITIHGIRSFRWRSEDDFTPHYYDRSFDLADVRTVDFIVVPFPGLMRFASHVFVSFGFADGTHIAISIEARRRKGVRYSALRGLWHSYRLMYVIADESDAVRLRTNVRRNDAYVYPMRADPAYARRLLADMLHRANALREQPEWYNTLANSCTTNLMRHIGTASARHPSWDWRVAFAVCMGRLAYERELIDTQLPFAATRRQNRITDKALATGETDDFSSAIRSL